MRAFDLHQGDRKFSVKKCLISSPSDHGNHAKVLTRKDPPAKDKVNRRKLLKRLSQGAFRNVPFVDMKALVVAFGFNLIRVAGSHHIFKHPNVSE